MMKAQPKRTSSESLKIRSVTIDRDLKRFIDLPYRLHRKDPAWVPQLRIAQKDILNRKNHPFYKTSDAEMYLAERDGRTVGRVMAILNRAHNEFHGEQTGFFGFFECERDPEAATLLLDAAGNWLAARGAVQLRGPTNPSTNYECGLLVEGFDTPPRVMMPYNPPYYAELIEGCGLAKSMDLYAYDIGADYFSGLNKLSRVAERLKKNDRITVRTVDLKNFKGEVKVIRRIYNDAWSRNWGFVPVSEEEFDHLAKDLKQLVDPKVVLIAEQELEGGERIPIGFLLAVPDINVALTKVKNGRLLPFGLFKLLWHSRKINEVRVITMGVVMSHQPMGIGSIFLSEIHKRGPAAGYHNGEMSWVLENNVMMNRAAELIGGRRVKTYRIYEKALSKG
jgi:hypothetical protein